MIPISAFYDCYREQGGKVFDPQTFERLFVQVCAEGRIFMHPGKQVQVTYQTAVNRLYEYYNQKFDIG